MLLHNARAKAKYNKSPHYINAHTQLGLKDAGLSLGLSEFGSVLGATKRRMAAIKSTNEKGLVAQQKFGYSFQTSC